MNFGNKNTRMAYYRAVTDFFAWLDAAGIGALVDIEPLHVATYIEALQDRMAKPTVKQHLAAIRMLFDWLVTGGILASNPATSVRGPKHVVKRGKTPVLTTDQARVLIESIDTSTLVGLRDRALIGVMTYAFARIGAVVSMRVEDYFAKVSAGGSASTRKAASATKCRRITSSKPSSMNTSAPPTWSGTPRAPCSAPRSAHWRARGHRQHRVDAWRMIQRRSAEFGMKVKIGCHTVPRAAGRLPPPSRMASARLSS
jgi:site-specific recombinase XerC